MTFCFFVWIDEPSVFQTWVQNRASFNHSLFSSLIPPSVWWKNFRSGNIIPLTCSVEHRSLHYRRTMKNMFLTCFPNLGARLTMLIWSWLPCCKSSCWELHPFWKSTRRWRQEPETLTWVACCWDSLYILCFCAKLFEKAGIQLNYIVITSCFLLAVFN